MSLWGYYRNTSGEDMIHGSLFCENCDMMITKHNNYSFCSSCVFFRYNANNLDPTVQPSVVTPRGLALAATLLEAEDVEIDRWNEYHSRKGAIVRDPYCTPSSLQSVNSSDLLFDYLNNLIRLMSEPLTEPIEFTSTMNNARTACLTEAKRILYGKLSMKIQIDPFEKGARREIFEKMDFRFKTVIVAMSKFVEDFHYCFGCECFGDRSVLLGEQIKSGDECADCR